MSDGTDPEDSIDRLNGNRSNLETRATGSVTGSDDESDSGDSQSPRPSGNDDSAPSKSTASAGELASEELPVEAFYQALEAEGRPVATALQVARRTEVTQEATREALERLTTEGSVRRLDVESDPVVFYPTDWGELASRERVVVFPSRREIVVDRPTQYTRAQLSQFAHLVDSSGGRPGTRGYLYRVRQEDIWAAPFEKLESLLSSVRAALPERYPHLEGWIEDQWERAHRFELYTHEDGYVVLEAATEALLGNVADEHLEEEDLRAPISETEAWVNEDRVAAVKRALYEAGYPVADDRQLESGADLDIELTTELRGYQSEWVERFLDRRSGVFVGPPGSGKTVTAIAAAVEVGGETLVLVPSRELAAQWREELLRHTTLDEQDVGEYHGGEKQRRPVTIATYQTAGMNRHRGLFEAREWGLIVYDEAHHIPAPVFSRSADLQAKHRLGLSATPVRETGNEDEIYTLIGSPIGADWDRLFAAGFVQEPEVEIRYTPWRDDLARNEYVSTDGRQRRQLAAQNPAKIEEIRFLLAKHADRKGLVFVEYLDQGDAISNAIDVPFISGETAHSRRRELFESFRNGTRETLVISRVGDEGIDLPDADLAIVASGLGGSRRQGAQRAGRTMRPAGTALVYVLATQGSSEEDFARRRMRHLAEKGIRVREMTVEDR